MELAVPLNDTESGKNERTSIFPTGLARNPSSSALPGPSPLRKSTRGVGGTCVERGNEVIRLAPMPLLLPFGWVEGTIRLERSTNLSNSRRMMTKRSKMTKKCKMMEMNGMAMKKM
jgi:hypothetical protein